MILHAQGDSAEINAAASPVTGADIFRMMKAKERELAYQKVLLEGCKEELASLKAQIEEAEDPEEREDLMDTARKFAMATQGKKEQFVISYGEWKTAMLKMDLSLQKQKISPGCDDGKKEIQAGK